MKNIENPQVCGMERLLVIDKLEVGPPRIEKKRIFTPYTITQGSKNETAGLIYSFKEDVFDPEEIESQNLGAMITAQVALNYGLFCRQIIFKGIFDKVDRTFIRKMAENTAREIFVKKILQPNPLLIKDFVDFPALTRSAYLQSEISFSGRESEQPKVKAQWKTGNDRYAVLLSGGKESLLSFGVLDELGKEVHPLFINESGRHWFSALNAYRYFKGNCCYTERIWTNSDRIFVWFLRHLNFVRSDFLKIRADDYPVRLWTVAGLVFGTLPFLRKRGIGRLVIGDEFDTTRRQRHQGISHYDGLYDQSRYFDRALSDYFARKGWGITQLSILRSLSELLVEKILSNRYPKLLQYQVSCHAAHVKNGRVRPCGRCEKCTRITGMLKALGIDPGICGYTEDQISFCLKKIVAGKLHQENTDVEHLLWILTQKGLTGPSLPGVPKPCRHPEIMKIRVDPKRSPLEEIPGDIRQQLLSVFLAYAEGIVQRNHGSWNVRKI